MRTMVAIILLFIGGSVFAANSAPDLNMLDVEAYQNLSKFSQTLYLKKVHQAIAEFEQKYDKSYTFASNSYFDFSLMRLAYAGDAAPVTAAAAPAAQPATAAKSAAPTQAASTDDQTYGTHCVIGGIDRNTYQRNGHNYCPTTGRSCHPYGSNGFMCGKIFGEACVKRLPTTDISENCAKALSDAKIEKKTENYASFKKEVQAYYKDVCQGKIGQQEQTACTDLNTRMTELDNENGQTPAVIAAKAASAPTALSKCDLENFKSAFGKSVWEVSESSYLNSCDMDLKPTFNEKTCDVESFTLEQHTNGKTQPLAFSMSGDDFTKNKTTTDQMFKQVSDFAHDKGGCTATAVTSMKVPNTFGSCNSLFGPHMMADRTPKLAEANYNCHLAIKVTENANCQPDKVTMANYDSDTQANNADISKALHPVALTLTEDQLESPMAFISAALKSLPKGVCTPTKVVATKTAAKPVQPTAK